MVARSQQELFNSSFTKIEFEGDLKQSGAEPPTVFESVCFTKKFKSVCFAKHDEVFEIPHMNDLSDEEIDAVWMSDTDFKSIRKECRKVILAIERGCFKSLAGVELRGLEHHLFSQRKQKDAIREILYSTVEKLQSFQDETKTDVSDMMAEMCQKVSTRSGMMAQQMALGDEVETKL
ncbi:unnamed protein product [Cylindrotheca closterium]|uniref:Uncharacterized protein n=1 Tax=Cylindrotheca closterium TaxID=2856 RepID=A0AAD2JH42_9STRA|nr:unnamed protein product [Cylindrotheca closterium]